MPNPLDHLYDELKVKYPDFVDRGEFVSKLGNEDELKKLHQAASQSFKGFVGFDDFKNKVSESLSTYDQDSDYKAQSAPAEQESAPTDITIPRREEGRQVPPKPQNGGVESEAHVPTQPTQPVDTHVDAEAFDRETGDLDELDRRYQEKVKRLEGYGATEGLYANEEAARKHYEAYSRLLDEAEQDRLVYNRRVKAMEDERAEQQRQLDLQSKDRKTRRSAEYGGYTNDQVRKEQERLKKERAYLEDPKSKRNADYSKRVMEYNADQSALSGEADKRNKSYERKRAMYDEVKTIAEDPDVQKRITGNDTVAYVLSGNNPYALQSVNRMAERAKTMTDEELFDTCKTIAWQKYARGYNRDIYAPLAGSFLACYNELMYRMGGDEPKSALEMRYDMIDKATEGTPEGDRFMLSLRNYLDGTAGMGTANYETDDSERANIPQFAVVDYFNNLLAQKQQENTQKVTELSRLPQFGYGGSGTLLDGRDMQIFAAAADINYDAILQQAFDEFGDNKLKAYITAHSLRNGISIDESARRVYQYIWNETIGKEIEESRPKSGAEFFMRRITSDNMFGKLIQLGIRGYNGNLVGTDPFAINTMVLDEYAKDHPGWDTAAVVTNFTVMEGPIFSGYGKIASGLVGATERAVLGAALKTTDKVAIEATARTLSQSLMYRLAKGGATGALVGFQYGTMSGAIDQAYYNGDVDFGKVIANGRHMARDFALMHGVSEMFGVTGDAILRRGQRNLRNGQGKFLNRLETTSLHFLNNVAKTTTNAAIVTGLYAAIDKPALERENKKIEAENKKIEAENARLPEDQQKPLKPLNQIASVEDTFYSSLRMFAGLDAVGMLRSAWSIGVRGQYERNKHVKIHFDKFDREALEKTFGKNPNSLLRQIVFGNVDGVPAKWFEIDPEAEAEIYKELGRELTQKEKESYATYGFTELRKVILNKDIPWATRAKIVSVVTGRVVQEPPVAKATIDFVMDSSGTRAKRIIVKSIDLEGNVIQAREFDGQREFEAARSLYEALNDRGWRNNAMLCGDLVIDAIEDKTYADTVDEMAREKGIAPDQFEQMVFGIKQKDITGEKVTYQERQLVDEFDKRHQEKQDAEIKLTGPGKLFEQVAREVFGADWKQANAIPFKSWGEMTQEEMEFVNKYIERMGAMGVAERNKLMNANPDWVRTAKEYEESVRRRMEEAERPAEAEPLPALEDEKVSVETPAEERVEPVPEVIELEEDKPAEPEPAKEETPAEEPVAEEKPDTEGQPQAGTIGFEPTEQPTERERFDAERKEKAATITDADIETNREALGIPEGTALTDEARQIYAEDLAEDLMRYERFKRGESDEKARFHDYWEGKFNPKRPKLEKPVEKQEEPVEEFEEEEVTETDALIEQLDNLKGRSDLERYRNALKVFAGDDEIMAILEDLEPHDITEWVSSFLGLDSGKGYSMLWESKTRGGTVIAKGFKEETGWSWNDVKGFAFMFDNKNGMSPRRVAEKIWEELPSGIKDKYSDVDVFNIMMDLFGQSSRKSDLTGYIRNNRMEQVRELLNRRRNNELDEIARYKERENRGDEESIAPPVSDDEEQNEFAVREDDVAPFSLLSLNYRQGEVEGGTIRSRARTRKQIGTIAKALGYKIRWVADKSYNAKIDTDEKVLYLNIRTDQPLEAVMGHEVTHDLRKSDPQAYETLKRYAQDLLGQEQWDSEVADVTETYNEEYERRGWQPIRADKAEEEVVCDTMGKVLHTKKGLRELAGSLDPGVAGKVYRLMKDITDKVKSALGKEHDYSVMDSALQEFLESVEQRAKMDMPINDAPVEEESSIEFSLRRKPSPKKTGVGYKVFFLKDGKLYPPMVANPGGEATPFGVWLDADAAPIAGKSKTGRNKVKAGGKGTQGGSGTLAHRPGWHLGKIPYALQFNRGRKVPNPLGILNKKGKVIDVGEFFPNDFVWAEVEYAADKDYQEEAHGYGVNANGKYNPSLAGLPRVPEDGSYEYRTNPNPATDPWIITGAMKVNRILKPSEVDEMVRAAGREPQKRQEGAFTDEQIDALNRQLNSQTTNETVHPIQGLDGYTEQDVLDGVRGDIEAKLEDAGVDGVTIKGMALHGSRMRGDARADSDLDVVVEYEGNISEDGLFNILNDEPMYFDGVKVDINPITRGKSGTLEQYMERSHRYDEEQLRDESTQSGTSFSLKREGRDEDKVPTFYSNAERAVEGVKQNKATAEQWKAMLTKAGGIKAGEDKWMGLSQWLDEHKGETLTKDEVLQFVRDNGIQMEEMRYQEGLSIAQNQKLQELNDEFHEIISDFESMYDKYDEEYYDFMLEMEEKYGDGWEYEMSPGERATEDRLLNERQKYGLRSEVWGLAFDEMVSRYGDDFDLGFYNDGTGDLVVSRDISGDTNDAALYYLGNENEKPINSTRLDYTTEGLENKREIAFVVPDVEPYQESDDVHFGPENQGKAVMWVRFGEARDADGKRVLVIDEIQSNRHQDAREKGYKDPVLTERLKQIQQEIDAATKEFGDFNDTLRQKYGVSTNYTKIEKTREEWGWNHRLVPNEDVLTKEEVQKWKEGDEKIKALRDDKNMLLVDRMWQEGVPAAPFEKNWHEVAMKRMLRLAAEEGFDKVAWTTGMQQAERYDIGNAVERIEKLDDRAFLVYPADGSPYQELEFDEDGVYRDDDDALLNNKTMADIFGKETAEKLKNLSDGDQLTGEGLRIGGEGMKGFYDQMLPRFMDKYGKKWGVKVGEVTLNTPGRETMHSVDVNEDMRRSVMEQGQPLFSLKREDSQKVFDTAKRKFGETKNIREAGYILPDGSMLDFSGRHELDPGTDSSFLAGRRATDHRAINQISFVYDENGDEVDTGVSSDMPDFIKRGAIRIDDNAGAINLSTKPTKEQRAALRAIIADNGGDVSVDFGDGWDSDHYVEYTGAKHTRVLGDIDRYFDEGIKPEGNAQFSLKRETRTDADGNEVYTETREDGTKDREITTYGDGSKKALWYDDKGNLKERLVYFPNGEVSQVANYDSDGNLTRNIQYDENRRTTRYYLPAIGTDWQLDENGIARGKSNGVEIKPYNFQFSLKRKTADLDKEYVDAIKRGDERRAIEMLLNKALAAEGITPYIAPHGYGGSHRDIAKRLKTNEGNAVVRAVADMQRFIPDNAVLVPMPPHEGEVTDETDTMILADALSVITGKPVIVALEGEPRESRYAAKAAGRPGITAEEMGFRKIADIPDGKVPIIIDNVVGTGETAKAAVNALGGGITLAYAKATRSKATEGLKNATITYDDKGNVIPLSKRFDAANSDVNYSLKRRRNRDDYTDEDRADAAIIANTYLAQADALRQQIEADRQEESRLVEERNRLLAIEYPAADPADRPAIMDRINDLRNQINDLRNANYENNTKLRSMDYEYRVAKEILEQGAVTDEEAARFDAGQMTREEKVLESLFKAAADSRADKKAKQKAIRGLVRELVAITDNFKAAMKARGIESQRKHYDKGTVDHIIRLAKAMMGTGYIDNMTSYEVKRLMGMINNAATRESIEEQAGRIVDMMLDHQIRTLRKDFDKQLKVTGQKTNSSGVQVQAGLDQEGQVVMEAMRKSMQIIADSAGERYDSNGYLTEWGEFYEKTLNDMGDADPVKAEQARKIFEGVWLASKWYNDVRALEINDRILRSQMEDFKASNKPAKDADADTKQRYNDALADYQEMLRQNKIKIIEAYERMTGDVGMTQADSMRRAKEFADAQKQRVEEIQHNANSDLQDVDDNTQVKTPESRVFGANKNNVLARLLFASAGTYEKFMRFFGRMAPHGEGYLFKRFMTQYHHARQNYWKGRHSAFEEMDKKMAEVFGKKKMHWSDIYEMTRDHKKFPTITVSYWDGYRNGQPYLRMDELNQSEALYLYMINKMPDGRMKLRKMGITDDKVQQMAGQIDGRLIQLADWLQNEFLPKMRVKYNETHKRVFGADMAAIEDYFPLRINKLSVASDMDITERDMSDNKPSTITGAIVKRRVNTKPIDLHTDAFDVALSHIDEMEHWSAFAEFNRDNNTLVNYNRFRTKVHNMKSLEFGAGDVLWKNFTDAVAIATDAYHPRAGSRSGDHYSTRVAKFVSTAKIALRPYTALKQLLSIPAFWADSDPLEQMKATVDVVNTWQWAIDNLPGFAERWQSKQAGNIKLANYNDLSGLRRRKAMQRIGRAGMWANAAIDGLACAMGGKAVYETKLKRYRKMGYDESTANEKALIDAAVAYNNSQQSSEGAYVSPLQVDRTWFSNAFSVFRSASMGYTRRMNTSLRQLRNAAFKPGYGAQSVEFLKKQMMRDGLTEEQAEKWAHRIYRRANLKAAASVAIFGQILPFTWNLGANMFYLLFGDDNKEKEGILADSFRHSFFGPVEGLTGGNVISELGDIAADTAIGNIWGDSVWGDSEAFKVLGYRDFSTMPLSSDLSSLLKYFARDEVKAANEVVNILFQVATGVNPQTITDWVAAILDLSRSDMERRDIAMFVMRMLSTPQSQLDKFYLDQMNLSQEQAAKMSVDDLIKRYATYKRWRETPLTGWMYSDEREKKVEEKFQKRYEEMLEERSIAEEGLRGTINEMTDLPRKRTMMQKLQKELTDSIEATDPDLYKKALEGEKADDDEYVRHVTDKDVEQMAELAMKKKALYAAHERKKQADKDRVAGRITKEEYDAIYKECAHQWKLYNYLDGEFPKDIKEMKLKMEPDAQSEHKPEYWMDSIRTLTDEALRMRPEDMKLKKADRKHYQKKDKNK